MARYDHKKIEKKWQKEWARRKIYQTKDALLSEKCYVLDMFPYPSGEGLHVGHPKGYIATDIYSRFKRMSGFNVLHPMGWDAFGLPAENFAIKNKIHPRKSVDANIKRYKEQLSIIGFDHDWSREINTTDPEYYKWTQWIFLEMYKKGLAYQSHEPINWCPSCQTGLANEDLEDGKCERCGSVVEKRPMRQWVLKITDYAERLLTDLDGLNWPEYIKESQRNWIGKSEGAEINFSIEFEHGQKPGSIPVFTTRPDTIFGATALVFSPDHPWVRLAINENHKDVLNNADEVRAYVEKAVKKTEVERTDAKKEKTGVKLSGVWAVNPASKEKIPVFVADYVLPTYGTGAVMVVPAHDERDFEFAKKYNLPKKSVIAETIGERSTEHIERNRVCAIIEKHGEVLCEKTKPHDTKYPGDFILTGGDIEPGENPTDALKRELLEKLGINEFKITQKLRTYRYSFFSERKNQFRTQLHFPFVVTFNTEPIKENPEETELIWVNVNQAIDMFKEWGNIDQAQMLRKYKFYDSDFFTGDGELFNSGEFSDLSSEEARQEITKKFGEQKTTYKLRDWVFSRQRYWGEPIPLIHCEKCGVVLVPEKDLPVKLPDVKNYEPTGTGESPLAAIDKWVNVKCPTCKGAAKRETNTMPQWAGSCWYYLRYMDPKNKRVLVDPKKEKFWSPVDMYVGGAEHATRHLIYARFWHKFLFDIGVASVTEPFTRLHNVGLILATDGKKMSKRYGNVINPDDVVNTYGADTFRVYEMFMGPFSQSSSWDTKSIMGSRRFVERVARLGEVAENTSQSEKPELVSILHKTIKKVTEDIERFNFNTAISSLMVLSHDLENTDTLSKEALAIFLKLCSPFMPHITEELWSKLKMKGSVHVSSWPKYDPRLIKDDVLTIAVQVNGKVRGEVKATAEMTEEEVVKLAISDQNVKKWLSDKPIRKAVYVKGRVLSLVI